MRFTVDGGQPYAVYRRWRPPSMVVERRIWSPIYDVSYIVTHYMRVTVN